MATACGAHGADLQDISGVHFAIFNCPLISCGQAALGQSRHCHCTPPPSTTTEGWGPLLGTWASGAAEAAAGLEGTGWVPGYVSIVASIA